LISPSSHVLSGKLLLRLVDFPLFDSSSLSNSASALDHHTIIYSIELPSSASGRRPPPRFVFVVASVPTKVEEQNRQ
jgi:hypothetical protein